MKSVVNELQTQNFPRIRVGIGGSGNRDWVNFVIGKMSSDDEKLTDVAIDNAAKAVEVILKDGLDIAMNQFNAKKEKKKKKADSQAEAAVKEEDKGNNATEGND